MSHLYQGRSVYVKTISSIKDLQKRYLSWKYKRLRLKNITRIAIDEIGIGKGHRYPTVVLDLKTGAVIFVGDGKGVESLKLFFKRLKCSKAEIKAVAIDMSPSYIAAVLDNLPESTIVFDHFHVIKLFNDKLSERGRAIHRDAEGPLQKKVLKGTRWLLLKNAYNLNEEKNEKERLEEALLVPERNLPEQGRLYNRVQREMSRKMRGWRMGLY